MGGKRFILAALATLVTASGFASPAAAETVGHRVSPSEANAAVRFWTPERIARATETSSGSARSMTHNLDTRSRRPGIGRPQVGKLLVHTPYGPRDCTGTVISTSSLRLVLTAASCLYYFGSWAKRVVFVPGFRNGKKPYGVYKTKTMWVTRNWMNSPSSLGTHYDIGIVVTRKRPNGTTIGENVGALPYKTYPGRRGTTDIYGYPENRKEKVKRVCTARTRPWHQGPAFPGPRGMIARCDMSGASTGGPWISRYRFEDGRTIGVVDGLTSLEETRGRRSYLTSPYFGSTLVTLIRATEGG